MTSAFPESSRARILNSAEQLFAESGYHAVSLRQITTAAKVNLAAVNYHFYDKESLYRQILQSRLQQLNRRRLALLDSAEGKAGSDPVPLAELIHALAEPLFLPEPEPGPAAARLLGRLLSERLPFIQTLIDADFQPVMTRFGQALRRHQPSLPAADFVWRLSFIVGALHHAQMTLPDMPRHTRGLCRAEDRDAALANFTAFCVKTLAV